MRDTDRCNNCHEERANHNYINGKWMCPHEIQVGTIYGRPHTDNPDHFHQDHEACSDQEIKNYKKVLEHYNKTGELLDLPVGLGITVQYMQTEFEEE